jgi:hypothetical protein
MKSFDLNLCKVCADDEFRKKFGKVPDFAGLESMFSILKGTDKPLSYKLIRKMSSEKYWDFKEFWMIPGWWCYRKHAKKTKEIFKDLPSNERKVILVLYSIFKNIEVVSIILRLIDPDNFGIISPPVRCALGLKAKDNYVDDYLDYLSSLRMYKKEFNFDRAADADIALWALVERCLRAKSVACQNFKKYQERLIEIEDEYIKKSQLFKKMEEEILDLAGEEETRKQAEIERMKKEIRDLLIEREFMPIGLIKLEKSPRKPRE